MSVCLGFILFFCRKVLTYHLLCNHDDCLYGESAVTVVEEVFQTGSEQVDDENIVKTLLTKVVDIGNTG